MRKIFWDQIILSNKAIKNTRLPLIIYFIVMNYKFVIIPVKNIFCANFTINILSFLLLSLYRQSYCSIYQEEFQFFICNLLIKSIYKNYHKPFRVTIRYSHRAAWLSAHTCLFGLTIIQKTIIRLKWLVSIAAI